MSYLGSALETFWQACEDDLIHPLDAPFFDYDREMPATKQLASGFVTNRYGPWPFDGPLDTAKVVICYANPYYQKEDEQHRELIQSQRDGRSDLPEPWDRYYQPRIGAAFECSIAELRSTVAVFNVCPYPSLDMSDRATKFASGLPSVWAAQKHLREVLIPKAQAGNLFLVFARKHQLWGVIEGFSCETIAFSRNRGGHLGPEMGQQIRHWLKGQSPLIHKSPRLPLSNIVGAQ